jgi:hypothetical protein
VPRINDGRVCVNYGCSWQPVLFDLQIVTAGILIRALCLPLREGSLGAGWRLRVKWRLPTPASALRFLQYAGPICGVLVAKVLTYSE